MKFLKQNQFIIFLVVHFLVWSLIPLLRHSLPMDSIEAIVWGNYCDWGTNKHPPLSGFLAYWFYTFGGHSHYAVYALSQCCVLIGFIYIYKLARRLLDKENAMLAVMVLEGVIYYGFSALEFNVNVVSLALWPLTAYYFYLAVNDNKSRDWLLTGLFAGLNLFNKYISAILLLAMVLYMVADKNARQKFKTSGPYLAAAAALIVIMPHLIWLYQHDFFVLDYFLGRSTQGGNNHMPFLRHVVYPLRFLGSQLLFSLGTILIYFIGLFKAEKIRQQISRKDNLFIFCLGVMPLLLMVLISLLGGIKLKSMWGFPVMFMLGIILFKYFPRHLTLSYRQRIITGVYLVMGLLACAEICIIVFNKSDKLHLNAPAYGKKIEQIWHNQAKDRPFNYVAGDVWWADNAALYAPSKPRPVIWGEPQKNPWFDAGDIESSGALLISSGMEEYKNMARKLGNVSEPQPLEMEFKNLVGKTKKKTIYYGFYNL